MAETNVLLTGVPRSGTTLTCNLLNKLPDTVALHEPMRGQDIVMCLDDQARVHAIERFLGEQRRSILVDRSAVSRTVAGIVPDNPFGSVRSPTGLRQHLDEKSLITVDKDLSPDFMLVIKHTSSFVAALAGLAGRFPVYALVRNPLSVLASWGTVDAPPQRGRSATAERIDADLKMALSRLDDPLERQIHLLGWFHEQFRRYLPKRSVIRYESLIESQGRALSVIRPEAERLAEPLNNQNLSDLYDRDHMVRIGERLLASEGAYWDWYPRQSVVDLLDEVERIAVGKGQP